MRMIVDSHATRSISKPSPCVVASARQAAPKAMPKAAATAFARPCDRAMPSNRATPGPGEATDTACIA